MSYTDKWCQSGRPPYYCGVVRRALQIPGETMEEQKEDKSYHFAKKVLGSKIVRWGTGLFAALLLLLFVGSFFLDEPLRTMMEKNMNSHLKGYSVRLPGLHFQLIGLSLTLKGLTISQQAHPEPPVANFPILKASIHWREILTGRLVAEFRLEEPKININLLQLRSEAASDVPLKERGWQQAIQDIYPLKINNVVIRNASITYVDLDPKRPLILSHLNLQADNIRNLRLPDKIYPSSFHLDTQIFGAGHGSVDGKANFLAEPVPSIKAGFTLDKIPIAYFKPMAARSSFSINDGILGASGNVEYSPEIKKAHLTELAIQGMKIDYIHSARTTGAEKKRVAVAGKMAEKLSNKPGMLLSVDQLNLTRCMIGMVNKSPGNSYHIFIADTDLQLKNLSNHFSQGPADVKLSGKFMGSGLTTATARFRPEIKGPDIDLYVKIEDTQLKTMNDLLRAYGDFDVTGGVFSFVSELHIKNDVITGYIKPFFKDMKVFDRRQDKDKGVFHQFYEMLVGGVSTLLENRTRGEVATKADISGSVVNPQTNTWQIIGELVKNAFFKAILPSFEKEVRGSKKP